MAIGENFKQETVAIVSATDNTVIAGATGKHINVYAVAITTASPVDFIFKDGSTTKGRFLNQTSITLDPMQDKPRYTLSSGNGFVINLSAAGTCTGNIWYTQT